MYDFIKFNESEVLEEAIEQYEAATNTKLYAGDERRILLNTLMYPVALIAAKANYLANQYYAQTAVIPGLQYIGEGRNVFRQAAQKALVSVQFSIAAPQTFDITIPAGTRVTADGAYFFATMTESVIPHGNLSVVVNCEATSAGASHNGFVPGTLKTLVDSILYISEVSNTNTSAGGADIESEEDYRNRILLKPFNYNTAGAEAAYVYLAKSADSTIGSVNVLSSASSVLITILSKDGTIPSDLVVSKVSAALTGASVRPLADMVTVQKPTAVSFAVDIGYKINTDDQVNVELIKSKVTAAVNEYIAWQSSELGRSINPDILKKYILNAGAYTVTINSPGFITVNKQSVAQLSGQPVVTYQGLY